MTTRFTVQQNDITKVPSDLPFAVAMRTDDGRTDDPEIRLAQFFIQYQASGGPVTLVSVGPR